MFNDAAAQLARAQDYVLKGREFVATQQAWVDDLRLQGQSTDQQEKTLRLYVKTLVLFKEHLVRVQAEA